jgi:hypothetical protein
MGYDLHITRAEDWAENEGHEITLNEWLRYVESDTAIQRDPQNSPADFLFLTHPKGPAPLWWYRGEIYTKNPDKPTVQKMIEIAAKLGARVQGDDGEFYDDTSAISD